MRKTVLVAAASAGLALLAGAAQAAGETGSNAAAKAAAPSASSTAVQQAHLAAELADYGRKAHNPMALVLAAELTAATAGPEAARAKTTVAGPGVASLLDEARAMAGPDATLAPAIQRVAALESKGRVNGPSRTYERILAGATDSYATRFVGGERASVYVEGDGDGDTDLNLYVFDQNGSQVCSDTDDTDTMLCQWTPAWTGTFTVKVKNYGRVCNNYVLRTN